MSALSKASMTRGLDVTLDWLDSRTNYKAQMDELLYHPVPKEVSWMGLWGSIALFIFIEQAITGVLLATRYQPTVAGNLALYSIYGSNPFTPAASMPGGQAVQGIHDLPLGTIIQSMHSWGAQAMVVAVLIHMLRVAWAGAYKPPRELNWISGVFLFIVVLGFAFTGYLLPWDQRAYWATTVGTAIAGLPPVAGPWVEAILRGGQGVGQATLTRFYAIHMLVLPAALIGIVGLHLYLMNYHGISEGTGDMEPEYAAGPVWDVMKKKKGR